MDAEVLKDVVKLEAYLRSLSPDQMQNLTVNEVPILHYLARLPFRAEHGVHLDNIIKMLRSSGYDINQVTDRYIAKKRVSLGFTALLAAVEQSNLQLVDYLLRNGGRADIRDERGLSPLHWAVIVGDPKCVNKLVTAGAQVTSTEAERRGEGDVHPILHTAVDEGRADLVFYFLERKLVDANEEAVYQGVLSEASHTQFPHRYNSGQATLETQNMVFTPLGRAVRMRKIPVIQILLKKKAVNYSGFSELHFCIVEGDSEVACMLKDCFSDEQLASDKINGKWALHCFHPSAFQNVYRIEKTKELIRHYVNAGWDINSMSECDYTLRHALFPNYALSTPESGCMMTSLDFKGYNLLHLACFSGGHEIIKFLVEEGADVNMKTKGKLDYTPLQILILLEQWDSASYLVEKGADLNVVSGLGLPSFIEFLGIKGSADPLPGSSVGCTATQLLLRLGRRNGMPLLHRMLQEGVVMYSPKEFHMAVEGANPESVEEIILTEIDLSNIAHLNITWMNELKFVDKNQLHVIPVPVPTLLCLLNSALQKKSICMDVPVLANIMTLMVSHGYDCNLVSSIKEDDVLQWDFGNTIWSCCEMLRVPLIFSVLKIDFQQDTNLLLKTLLEVDHVELNVQDGRGMNPVEFVLDLWHQKCMSGHLCFRSKTTNCWETVRLLITHGVDVSAMVIGENFKYHYGYLPMIQVLYSVGAKIDQSFFGSSVVCHNRYLGTESFAGEVAKLEKWIKSYDKNKLNLKLICRLAIRKMCKTIGDLNMMASGIPDVLKNEIRGDGLLLV